MKKFRRAAQWIFTKTAEGSLLYLWLTDGARWALNVVEFWVWFMFAMMGFTWLANIIIRVIDEKETAEKWNTLLREPRIIPQWISGLVELVFALTLASQGHFVVGAAILVTNYGVGTLRATAGSPKESQK